MRTVTRVVLVSVALVLALSASAPAHEGRGGIDALPVTSTRGLALGETGLTEIGEAEAFMSNPSCLPSMTGHQVRVTYGTWFGGLTSSRTVLVYATALGGKVDYPGDPSVGRRFGLGIALDRTGVELSQGSGWAANVLYVGLAWAPVPYVSMALAPKFIFSSSDLPGGEVSGYAIDWGLRLDLTGRAGLGFVTRNIPGSAGWKDGESENLPAVYSLGAHYVLPYDLKAELMFAASGNVDNRLGLGIEAPILDSMLCVRFGISWISGDESRSAPTAGLGIDLDVLDFDYALKLDQDWATGTTHRVSIRLDF
ncbi:MAG: hypothetical protein PVJ42_08265 [bacterium]|jgi:hypothetical protein